MRGFRGGPEPRGSIEVPTIWPALLMPKASLEPPKVPSGVKVYSTSARARAAMIVRSERTEKTTNATASFLVGAAVLIAFVMYANPLPGIISLLGWVYVLGTAARKSLIFAFAVFAVGSVAYFVRARITHDWPFTR